MVPIIDNKRYHFGPRGLYDGLVLLGDDETHSYWNHITGECVYGSMKGEKMHVFPIHQLSVERALAKWPDLQIALSRPPLIMRFLAPIMNRGKRKAFLPPGFRKTMATVDNRLPEMTSGLGVIIDNQQRFYPIERIKHTGGTINDQLNGRTLTVMIHQEDQTPYALDDDDKRPMQLFTRWYGFYLTYPHCSVFEEK